MKGRRKEREDKRRHEEERKQENGLSTIELERVC